MLILILLCSLFPTILPRILLLRLCVSGFKFKSNSIYVLLYFINCPLLNNSPTFNVQSISLKRNESQKKISTSDNHSKTFLNKIITTSWFLFYNFRNFTTPALFNFDKFSFNFQLVGTFIIFYAKIKYKNNNATPAKTNELSMSVNFVLEQ